MEDIEEFFNVTNLKEHDEKRIYTMLEKGKVKHFYWIISRRSFYIKFMRNFYAILLVIRVNYIFFTLNLRISCIV